MLDKLILPTPVTVPAVRLEIVAELTFSVTNPMILAVRPLTVRVLIDALPAVRVEIVAELTFSVITPILSVIILLTVRLLIFNEVGIVDKYGPPFMLDKLILPTPVMAPVVDMLRTLTDEI